MSAQLGFKLCFEWDPGQLERCYDYGGREEAKVERGQRAILSLTPLLYASQILVLSRNSG